MREIISWAPVSLLGIGALSAFMILLNHDRPRFGAWWSFFASGIQLSTAIGMLPAAFADITVASPGLELLPGVVLRFRADSLGLLFLTLSSILWLITTAYSVGYLGGLRYRHQPGYYAAFAMAAASAAGVALAANAVTFLICYEALTLATWPLVVTKRTPGVLRQGRAYLAYTLFGGQLLLGATVWAGLLAPGADFAPGGFLAGTAGDGSLRLLFVLFLIGVGVKAAIFPFHGWLPAAMVAPTPVSALLHAVAVVKAGAFGVLRLTGWVFGPDLMRDLDLALPLALLAGGTILFASARALREDHLKRRLAYSTISQLSYIVLGGAIGTPLALAGAAFHIVAHGFLKITLFFCAGCVYVATGRERISELAGVGRAMPITFAAFTVGALGMAGIPLLPGFLSKWNLALGGIAGGQVWVAVLLVVSGLLNLAYYLPILKTAVFERDRPEGVSDPSAWLFAPPALAALAAIILGVLPDAGPRFWFLAESAARTVAAAGADLLAGGVP